MCRQNPLTGQWVVLDFGFDARFADRSVAGLLYGPTGDLERVCGWTLPELAAASHALGVQP